MKHLLILIIVLFAGMSCKKEPPAKPSSDINSAIDVALLPPQPPSSSIKYRDTLLEDVLINGVTKKCRTYMADRVQRFSSFDYFYAEDKGDIWPGNLVQSKYLRDNGRLVSLGNFPRDPLNYTFQGSMGSRSVNIASPANASFQTTFDNVSKSFWFMPPTYSQQTVQITYSTEQSLLDLGINYGFLAGKLAAKFQTVNTNGNTTLFMVVKNIYFNSSVEYPTNPAGFFGQNVNVSDLKRLIGDDNAPAYISNISYGRVALVKLVSSFTQRDVKASVELVLKGLGASLTASQKNLVSELQLTIEAAPGPNYVLKSLDDVYKFMDEGSQFNHRNGCVPVGYEARYLKNNSILMTHTGISYKINDCL